MTDSPPLIETGESTSSTETSSTTTSSTGPSVHLSFSDGSELHLNTETLRFYVAVLQLVAVLLLLYTEYTK